MTQLKDNNKRNSSNTQKSKLRLSPSPFNDVKTPLKSGNGKSIYNNNACNNENGYRMRTRSFDDEQLQQQFHNPQVWHERLRVNHDIDMFNGEDSSSCCTDPSTVVGSALHSSNNILHSSFDATLLRGGAICNSSDDFTLYENDFEDEEGRGDGGGGSDSGGGGGIIDVANTSLDWRDLSSGQKHQLRRPRRAVSGGCYQDLKPPGTIRKEKKSGNIARRRSGDTAMTAATIATSSSLSFSSLSKTPIRPLLRHPSPAPSSTAKRRLAPLVHPARQSPMRRVVASCPDSTSPAPFLPPTLFDIGSNGCNRAGCTNKDSNNKNYIAVPKHNQANSTSISTPTHQISSNGPHGTAVKKMSCYTGTTAGTAPLETTFEIDTESIDNNSPARFRFTSFPASLPRVNNPRTTPPVCPGSVRKRMSFDTEYYASGGGGGGGDDAGTATATGGVEKFSTEFATTAFINNSNNQDVNQSRDDEGTQNTSLSSLSVDGGHHQHLPHLPNQHPPHFASVPMEKLLLFPGEEGNDINHNHGLINNNLFGYSDDEEDEAVAVGNNHGISTTNESSDQIGAVRRTRLNFNVFLSPENENKNRNRNSNINGLGSKRIYLSENVVLSRPYDQNRTNSFPSSLSSHTQMNVSNIEDSSHTLSPPRALEKVNHPETPREVQVHFPLESECSPILGAKEDAVITAIDLHENSSETSSALVGDRLMPKTSFSSTSHFGFPIKHEAPKGEGSSTSSESTSTAQKRRLRPMPDMSAFENVKTSARSDRSIDDSITVGDNRGIPSMNRRACPPTPQRTPAWANEGGPHALLFQSRQNSLITTKVLLSCPSQVLEGRSSLEDSVLDEDSKASGARRYSFSKTCDRGSGTCTEKIVKNPLLSNKQTKEDDNMQTDVEKCDRNGSSITSASSTFIGDKQHKSSRVQITAPPKLMRRLPSNQDNNSVISFSDDYEILSTLGSGAFADVYKVRLKSDDHLYAVKMNRRQFRGKRDRDMALAEAQSMQRLQSVFVKTATRSGSDTSAHNLNLDKNCYSLYLLFFYRAWQENGYFYSQTELCCRDTCREMLDSLRFLWNSAKMCYPSLVKKLPPPPGVQAGSELDAFGRLVPNSTVWKICHDISAGLSHIHSHGIVHQDIKPSNIFFVANTRFGAMCKIGDFGMAGTIGSSGDGQEGDTRYMPPELLTSATKHTSSDIFSLGLTLYEIAMDEYIEMPSEGPHWHQLRSYNEPTLPACRGNNLQLLLQSMTNPDETKRPTAESILQNENVKIVGHKVDTFLQDYIEDVEEYDRQEEERVAVFQTDNETPRNGREAKRHTVRSPSLTMLIPAAPTLFSPPAKYIHS
eukprot:CAMPEP_0170881100 /NCGR_PEP_ID=MMETSP0734-20130129/32846_1 /TAXON_ID=186038 /ORGANISM="Fragilariopsis kerguelensis, Strain L26-C5" /LENGTH=1334 /DNA_ID=CAMNT_0011264783 /DNA_START=200 /DNA_END=4207 /DNA_ORIENTATION=-